MAAPHPNTTYFTPGQSPQPRSGNAPKPTLLAFHGSGSNSTIHTVQLARLSRQLKPYFNVISLEAPFPSAAGPGILPFFEGCGPFKRWIPPHEKVTIDGMKKGEASPVMPIEVESLIRDTVGGIRAQGGKVVGLIGFSQGTRVVAGLLKGTEIVREMRKEKVGDDEVGWLDFRFAISVCGSYPPPLIPAAATTLLGGLSEEERKAIEEQKIGLPTVHVQGKQDEWEWAGKLLIDGAYNVQEGQSEVMELEMGHHYPVQQEESERIKDWVLRAYSDVVEAERR